MSEAAETMREKTSQAMDTAGDMLDSAESYGSGTPDKTVTQQHPIEATQTEQSNVSWMERGIWLSLIIIIVLVGYILHLQKRLEDKEE
ncbi:hypothetical protein FV139_17655 [Parahaliea maris]|uniref:Uncharacterized protein n=1 Tax=Parahaliea maris TaxID=2716870 RepID=A0A5C8ZSZ5_9GAMM|nr:hypothetical protein [Parahaliea maris]TXS90800.1 hypothetical protein FV139_17655 [Parahaliea maris]